MGHEDQNQLVVPTQVNQTSPSTSQRCDYSVRNAYSAEVRYQEHSVCHQENCVTYQLSHVLLHSRDHDLDLYHVQSIWQSDQ